MDPSQVKRQSDHVRHSLYGCRIFYAVMYTLFYLAVYLYPNKLTDSLLYASCWFVPLSLLAVYFFLTAGLDPGFVTQDKTSVDEELGIEMPSIKPYTPVET